MSSLQPSVQPGLPADLGAQACQADEANFPTEGRRRRARFLSLVQELGGSSIRPRKSWPAF